LRQFTDRILETLRATPGVAAAAISVALLELPSDIKPNSSSPKAAPTRSPKSSPKPFRLRSYFATMRIPLLAGEVCRETDGPPTLVVNRTFADNYFPGAPSLAIMYSP